MSAISVSRTAGTPGQSGATSRARRERRAAFWFLLPDSLGLLVFAYPAFWLMDSGTYGLILVGVAIIMYAPRPN